jgi:predicted nucleic acid-binding protein
VANPQKVYWDSSVWIALIKGETVKGVDRCAIPKMILEDARDGKVTIYISRLTIVEVHKKRNYSSLTRGEDDRIQSDFFKHEYIKKIDVDSWVAERARQLAWDYGLRPNDAIHVASAIKVNVEVLHHWDGDFGKVPSSMMPSEEPIRWAKQTTLFP